ncbi:Winged helix-turn-helix transcription repressor DNA-binding [Penicillium bovifimosum]|uniref:Winged helix-turn-helix transcription repressor DNA-binding n=1 Tax=Penicillium bovifimosum TaxID=126998 RepID=A0A9W9GU45_9EURO|nr:Winged helix-turn-helix transcription repressor DNA-binding [Penicillium bovifimosum]KAJ5129958.1 Winged helix-turn-helix transcription repressor DNA-binding [Penicillium bovifimosum]
MKRGYSKLILEEFVLTDRDGLCCLPLWNDPSLNGPGAGFQVIKFWAPPGDGYGIIEAKLK